MKNELATNNCKRKQISLRVAGRKSSIKTWNLRQRGRKKREKKAGQSSGEETDGVTKQRMIVSNWDGSQSVTSENSQSYPLISPLSSVTCLFFPLTPSASEAHTKTQTCSLPFTAPLFPRALSVMFTVSNFPLCCMHTNTATQATTMTRTHTQTSTWPAGQDSVSKLR